LPPEARAARPDDGLRGGRFVAILKMGAKILSF
jgi:hypothetical protein